MVGEASFDTLVEVGREHWASLDNVEAFLQQSLLINYVEGMPAEMSYFYTLKDILDNYREWCRLKDKPVAVKSDFLEVFTKQGYDKAACKQGRGVNKMYKLDTPLVEW